MRSIQRENGVNVLLKYLDDRRLSNEELEVVHQYNATSYYDHVAGASAGLVSVLLCKKLIQPPRFKLITPPVAGVALFAAYSLVSNYRTDQLLTTLAAENSATSLARRLRRALDTSI